MTERPLKEFRWIFNNPEEYFKHRGGEQEKAMIMLNEKRRKVFCSFPERLKVLTAII